MKLKHAIARVVLELRSSESDVFVRKVRLLDDKDEMKLVDLVKAFSTTPLFETEYFTLESMVEDGIDTNTLFAIYRIARWISEEYQTRDKRLPELREDREKFEDPRKKKL